MIREATRSAIRRRSLTTRVNRESKRSTESPGVLLLGFLFAPEASALKRPTAGCEPWPATCSGHRSECRARWPQRVPAPVALQSRHPQRTALLRLLPGLAGRLQIAPAA